ncbi:hypothetical protein [Roseobacter fucihabitans]|uniref:hypothetical protein n=1 Tax=Roseobacter fucihabitans TaxID=1537242 RepID=UPI001652CBCD|nr:hypothetical protein [Roseobacter litoralis]
MVIFEDNSGSMEAHRAEFSYSALRITQSAYYLRRQEPSHCSVFEAVRQSYLIRPTWPDGGKVNVLGDPRDPRDPEKIAFRDAGALLSGKRKRTIIDLAQP